MNKQIIEARLKKLRKALINKGIGAAFVTKRENFIYLSGFTGSSAYLLITQDKAILVTDFRYVEQASSQAEDYTIVQYQGKLNDTLNELLKANGIENLGFEDIDLNYESYMNFEKNLEVKEFLPMGNTVEGLRLIKNPLEIETIKKSAGIADSAFAHILGFVKPGVSELELAAEIEHHMKKLGAKGQSFEMIVASGQRSSMPHGVASGKKLQQGDAITFDFGAIYDEYCSDMTRTVFLGQPEPKMEKIYGIVLEAQMKALEGVKAGLTGKEIDLIARDIIDKAGYGKNFGHGLGHGVGLEIHEAPRLSPMGDIKMQDGMVVTVEPGIYVSGLGGVRIEDLVVVSGQKPDILSKSTKEMIII